MTDDAQLADTPQETSRRSEIVSIAAALFDTDGYQNGTMESIASAANIAKPTLYHYFSSREEILFEIHQQFITLLLDRHAERESLQLSPGEELREIMADIFDLMRTHRGHVRVFFEHHRELSGDYRDLILARRNHYQHVVEDVILRGMENGEFRQCDPTMTALFVFGICNWSYQWYRTDGPLTTRELAEQAHGLITEGLRLHQSDGWQEESGDRFSHSHR